MASSDESKAKPPPKRKKEVYKPAKEAVTESGRTVSLPASPGSKWVIAQLSSLGEREKNIGLIMRSARQLLGRKDIEIFIPAISQTVREESQTLFYLDGYVFIKYIENVPYMKLHETTYFSTALSKIMHVNGERKRVFSLLDDKDLEPMRRGMEALRVGVFKENDDVKVIKGTFKGLLGKVSFMHESGEHVQVHIELRSKPQLIDFPASYLTKVQM